jgi:hypothetical protein
MFSLKNPLPIRGGLFGVFAGPLLVVGVMLAAVGPPKPAIACAVCITLPDASLADHLLSAEIIVLARPSPENSFKYAPITLIKGSPEDLARLPEIPFLVDSNTRSVFRNNPEASILFTYGAVDKDATGRSVSRSWRRIFALTPDRARFLEDLGKAADNWPPGSKYPRERVEFFADYLNSTDAVLRDTALIELDRAPYAIVQAARPIASADLLESEFRDINRFRFVPVSILLLGLQTDDSEAAAFVRSRYPRALQSGGGYLFEWALAGLELDGLTAVKAVDDALERPGRKPDERQNLIRALAKAGTVSAKLRDPIMSIFSRVLNEDSSLALNVAIAVRDWQDNRLDLQLKAILDDTETDPVTRFVIQSKLSPAD